MPEPPTEPTAPPDPVAERFYDGAMDRIRRFMAMIGVAATVVVWAILGWQFGIGVLLGCVLAWMNFLWLKHAVAAIADRVTRTGRQEGGGGVVARFVLRYALIAIGAYAIFKVSRDSLYGLLGGLFLTVAAILCEAVYEVVVSVRRGF